MSMKRSKQAGSSSERDKDAADGGYWAKPAVVEKTWTETMEGKGDDAFSPYALAERYAKGQLVTHAKFGKGIVVEADAHKVEILFEDGKKKLGHGQT
jgi:hypothetical protein